MVKLMKIIYFTGGAESGKSRYAEKYIEDNYRNKLYIATGVAFDEEMRKKISLHQERRDSSWELLEGYRELSKLISYNTKAEVVLLDCVTNLISNFMLENITIDWDKISMAEIQQIKENIILELENIIKKTEEKNIDLVFVTNEVGFGVVPPYRMGRIFREITGQINQYLATLSTECYLVVSGIKIKIK